MRAPHRPSIATAETTSPLEAIDPSQLAWSWVYRVSGTQGLPATRRPGSANTTPRVRAHLAGNEGLTTLVNPLATANRPARRHPPSTPEGDSQMRWPWTQRRKAMLLNRCIDRHLLGADWRAPARDESDPEIAELMGVVDSLRDAWHAEKGDPTLRSRVWLRIGSQIADNPETSTGRWTGVWAESPAMLTAMGWTSILSSGGMLTLAAVGAR